MFNPGIFSPTVLRPQRLYIPIVFARRSQVCVINSPLLTELSTGFHQDSICFFLRLSTPTSPLLPRIVFPPPVGVWVGTTLTLLRTYPLPSSAFSPPPPPLLTFFCLSLDEKDYDEQPRKYARTSGAGSANRKPHLQGRFSGRLETKEDEKRLVSECILLNALIGGETRGGDPNSNSLTWAELAQQADFSLTWNRMFPDPHRQQSNDAMVGGTRNTLAKIVRAMSGNEVRQYLATEFNNYVDLLAKKPLADYVEKVSTENRQLRVKLEECFAALRKANVATPSAPGPATPVPNPTLYPKLSSPPGPLPVIESGKGSSPYPSQGLSSTSPANLAAGFPIPSAPSIPVTPVDLSSLPMFSSPLAGWPNGTITPPAGMMSMPPTAGLPGVLPSIPLPNMPAMPTMPALTMPGGTNPFPLPTTLLPPTSTTTNTPAEEAKPATEPAAAPKTE